MKKDRSPFPTGAYRAQQACNEQKNQLVIESHGAKLLEKERREKQHGARRKRRRKQIRTERHRIGQMAVSTIEAAVSAMMECTEDAIRHVTALGKRELDLRPVLKLLKKKVGVALRRKYRNPERMLARRKAFGRNGR